ncbi:hypothetical protein HYPSUDRAFT_210039 [Hypholoma sublateritium FD-334 SS-4]|uniref:Uncharacterized protein n=1 Tax=Hypholoma sublateritium (strain FD-334 SS-4) TaxID=945553 RepID=A0A0D2N7Y2_HYPSF|nr:hypothetical protein HYPSUDRAFT_210039 [Hypholoma sublateritium FD-334 SS-4]
MQACLEIDKDKDIVKRDLDEFIAENTARKRIMSNYENKKTNEEPTLKPMYPNWSVMKGLWNSRLCELFIEYCKKEGYTDLKTLLQIHKPKKEETQAIAMERAKAKLHASAVRNRQHGRRRELYRMRLDSTEEGDEEDNILLHLGEDGMSSDESCDEADGTRVHVVHDLAWRSPEITRRVIKRDEEHTKLRETIFGAKKGNPAAEVPKAGYKAACNKWRSARQ